MIARTIGQNSSIFEKYPKSSIQMLIGGVNKRLNIVRRKNIKEIRQ